jgi:carbamoyltransferase
VQSPDSQSGSLLGPSFDNDDIASRLDALGAVYDRIDNEGQLVETVAGHLASNKVVGRFQGRMEFGPRALGNRSILGDPRSSEMQSVMNLKIKFRESFRPFAPVVLAEHAHEFFEMPENTDSPYMLLVFDVAESKRTNSRSDSTNGLHRANEVRSEVPAITHVDYTARVQTVDKERNPSFEKLLRAFYEKTGCPVLINTSFNVRGEPIVCAPEDAFRCFMATDMDVLVIESFVLEKARQPNAVQHKMDEHLAQFDPD